MDPKAILKKYGRMVSELGLIWGKSGNMSLRLGQDEFLITASGARLKSLSDKDLVFCRIGEDSPPGGPSMEYRMHQQIYRVREDLSCVLHSQPLFSTLVASSADLAIEKGLIPESIAYLREIGRISYHHPGSMELAQEVAEKIQMAEVLLLENHGVVSAGGSIEEAIHKTETLEFLCKLIVLARAARIELRSLPEEMVIEFIQRLKIMP